MALCPIWRNSVVETNIHQQKKDLIKDLNFWWHNPRVSDEKRNEVLALLKEALKKLQLSE